MDESVVTRVMPNSIEAEQSVVGSMILDRQAIITAAEILRQDDFYYRQYGTMFQTMVDMNNEGKTCRYSYSAGKIEGDRCTG